jgi:hypothetical protein
MKRLWTQHARILACGHRRGRTRNSQHKAEATSVGHKLKAAQTLPHKRRANAINAIILIIIIIIIIICKVLAKRHMRIDSLDWNC